ncbi:MAG: ATP-binding protein [bacterium]
MKKDAPGRRRVRLGARLAAAFIAVVAASVSVPSVYALIFLFNRVYDEATLKMKSDVEIASLLFEQKKRTVLKFATTAAGDSLVEKMTAFRLGEPLEVRMRDFVKGAAVEDISEVLLVDRDGIVLYRYPDVLVKGDSMAADPIVSQALRGREIAAFSVAEGGGVKHEAGAAAEEEIGAREPSLLVRAGAPVILHGEQAPPVSMKPAVPAPSPGEVVGAVCASYLVNTDRALLGEVRDRTHSAAIVYLNDRVINTTEKEWRDVPLPELLEGKPLGAYGVRRYPKRGEIGGFLPLKDFLGNTAGVVELRASTRKIQRDWRKAAYGILLFFLIGLGVSAVMGVIITRRITLPIRKLKEGAEEIGAGNLLYRIDVPGDDEITELARSFNEMGARLHLYMEQMRLSKIQVEDYSTRLREAHVSLERYSRQLEKVNRQLLDSNIKLQKAHEIKDTFLSTVSHELKTPLTTIIGYISMILKGTMGNVPPDVTESLEVVRRRSENLRDLINDLLSISRIDSGKLELRRRYVDIAKELRGLEEVFAERLSEKNLTLETTADGMLPLVNVDGDRINQVLFNLVGNSVKFTPENGRITVSASCQPESNSILISVSDTGIGIPRSEIGHIFERFYQVDRRDGRRFPGTGLGLAIAKELVELHGGGIWVESEEKKGSTFYFTIPVSRPGVPPEPSERKA